MFQVTCQYNRWQISKEGETILFGIGSYETAAQVAKLYGIVLSGLNKPNTKLRAVA